MATKTAKPTNGRPRQQHLSGIEPEKNPKIERLADRYQEKRDERMRLQEEESDARVLLHTAMKEAGLKYYELPGGRVCEIVAEEKATVRKAKKEAADA